MAVMLPCYDVVVWKWFNGNDFPYVDEVVSTSPLLAVSALMREYGLRSVRYAAVMLPDGVEVRWEKGVVMQSLHPFQCDRCHFKIGDGSLGVMCGSVGWCLGCVPIYVYWR